MPIQLPNTPITDTAQVSFAPLRFGKQLIGTELTNANNGAAQAVIGELITYTLVLTVPEGTTPNARITDTLPTGLAFATCTGVAHPAGSRPRWRSRPQVFAAAMPAALSSRSTSAR